MDSTLIACSSCNQPLDSARFKTCTTCRVGARERKRRSRTTKDENVTDPPPKKRRTAGSAALAEITASVMNAAARDTIGDACNESHDARERDADFVPSDSEPESCHSGMENASSTPAPTPPLTSFADTSAFSLALKTASKAAKDHLSFHATFPYDLEEACDQRQRVREMAYMVFTATGWRWTVWDHSTYKQASRAGNLHSRFRCCQDTKAGKKHRPKTGTRDHVGMDRFDCCSKLSIHVEVTPQPRVVVHLEHGARHRPYHDVGLTPEAAEIIREHLDLPPAFIQPLVTKHFPDITYQQIHSAWTRMSEVLWRKDDDAFRSAVLLLSELGDEIDVLPLSLPDGVVGFAWVYRRILERLRVHHPVYELLLDATYGTNASDLELYTAMTEADGVGIPVASILLTTATSIALGKRKKSLHAFMEALKVQYDIHPSFVHTDKDMAEINPARVVWPESKHQICWWHLKDLLEKRLGIAKLSTTPYHSDVAHAEFSFIDVSFVPPGRSDPKEFEGGVDEEDDRNDGAADPRADPNTVMLRIRLPPAPAPGPAPSTPPTPVHSTTVQGSTIPAAATQPSRTTLKINFGAQSVRPAQPVSDHDLASSALDADENLDDIVYDVGDGPGDTDDGPDDGEDNAAPARRRQFCRAAYRPEIIAKVEHHLNAHRSIPGPYAPTAHAIRHWAVKDMYNYCVERDLRECWAYLWTNHYCPRRWKLWARSAFEEIPRLRTTMICESHWKFIKTHYLGSNHKPRIDYLIWILVRRMTGHFHDRLNDLFIPNGRNRQHVSWRQDFKAEWRKLQKATVSDDHEETYVLFKDQMVCSCPYFCRSRFLLCKHVVQAMKPPPPRFFLYVRRYRTVPIWRHDQLELLDPTPDASNPFAPPEQDPYGSMQPGGHGPEPDIDAAEFESDGALSDYDDGADSSILIPDDEYDNFMDDTCRRLQTLVEMINSQRPCRDGRFAAIVRRRTAGACSLVDHLSDLERRTQSTRTARPTTFTNGHFNSMFYRTRARPTIN